MSSKNHGQASPSPDQGEVRPSHVAVPTPPADEPSPEPMAESQSPTQQDSELNHPEPAAECAPVDLEAPLPPVPGESIAESVAESVEESVAERVSKLEQRQEETVVEAEPTSLEERVAKLEQAMDEQRKQQQQQLEEKDQKLREKEDQAIRSAAEFDNFRRRTERERMELKPRYTCAVLREILPVLDSFERARKGLSPEKLETLNAEEVHHHYQGVYKQLVTALKRLNVSPMKVEGQAFDPALHEAVMREPSQEYGEDVVMEELQRGYHLEGEVLRHAMVKVSMGPGPDDHQPVNLE